MSNAVDDYALALAVLNAAVGIRFSELQAAQTSASRDDVEIHRLKERFEAVYAQREGLANQSGESLRSTIAELAPEVRAKVKGADDAIAPYGR